LAHVIFHVALKVEVNFALCHEGIWVSRGTCSHIILGTRWRWVVNL